MQQVAWSQHGVDFTIIVYGILVGTVLQQYVSACVMRCILPTFSTCTRQHEACEDSIPRGGRNWLGRGLPCAGSGVAQPLGKGLEDTQVGEIWLRRTSPMWEHRSMVGGSRFTSVNLLFWQVLLVPARGGSFLTKRVES